MPAERWRKRPVVIEAVCWDQTEATWRLVQDWGRATGRVAYWREPGQSLIIATLEGDMEARPGDYIIRGVQGEMYPCRPDIFLATYEPADNLEDV